MSTKLRVCCQFKFTFHSDSMLRPPLLSASMLRFAQRLVTALRNFKMSDVVSEEVKMAAKRGADSESDLVAKRAKSGDGEQVSGGRGL